MSKNNGSIVLLSRHEGVTHGQTLNHEVQARDSCVPAPVALTEREAGVQLVSTYETNSPNYKEWIFTLLLHYETNVGLGSSKKIKKYYEKLWRANFTYAAVAHHIKLNKVTIVPFIAEDLEMSDPHVYKVVKKLKKWGIVHYAGSINYRRKADVKGGPQPQIISWAPKPDPEDIVELRQKYYKKQNPAMVEIKKLIPMLIDEYVDPYQKEIKYQQIVNKLKSILPGYSPKPLADECASNLQKIGIKVWK